MSDSKETVVVNFNEKVPEAEIGARPGRESASEADRANGVPDISDEQISVEPMLQLFRWAHLPPHLQVVSRGFGELALRLVATTPRNPERTVALRKLREAKDCAITALLWKAPS